jgi:hypothetical protein
VKRRIDKGTVRIEINARDLHSSPGLPPYAIFAEEIKRRRIKIKDPYTYTVGMSHTNRGAWLEITLDPLRNKGGRHPFKKRRF